LVPFIRSASADLNVSAALAIISVITVQFTGIAALGFFKYAGKFFISPFSKPYGIGTFVGILELIGEIAKLISYSFRLFGNIFAGEVLLAVMLMLVPYLVPIPFLALEIFVGFIQALVFSMLTLVFLKMAVTEAAH
jgi:F-type H+-transporting ATPase subunit a